MPKCCGKVYARVLSICWLPTIPPIRWMKKVPTSMGKLTKPAIWDCISGFCGVETGVPLILTEVNKGRLTLNQYVKVACENPAKVWQIYPKKGAIRLGSDGDITIIDMDKEGVIDVNKVAQQEQTFPVARLES